MLLFDFLWTINAVASLAILYFFLMGMATGSISSRNMAVLLLAALVLASVLTCCIWLHSHNEQLLSFTLLASVSASALCYGMYALIGRITNKKLTT